jgi:MFS family permease
MRPIFPHAPPGSGTAARAADRAQDERVANNATEAPPSTWAPLRIGIFRALWLAVLGSQLGTWMQTVGAQWLLVSEPNAETLVSLVQTASMLPILLLALPAGVLADTLDRRRMLIAVQLVQVAIAGGLAVLTLIGQMSPALLLTLTFALGCGASMTVPTYQAIIPELVPRDQLPSAASLGAISINVARAVGPALAGVLVAWTGVAAVFALNAVTFLVFAGVLVGWRRPPEDDGHGAEPFLAALRAGGRYVRHSLIMRRILTRLGLLIFPGVVLWALLPLIASKRLGMGSAGYGLLLAAVGAGAVAGAFVMPRLRARLSENQRLVAGHLVYAAALIVVALVPNPVVVAVALVPAGTAWMVVLSNANAAVQMFLPAWVRARGLGSYQIVFFGGQGLGALIWGLVAQHTGLLTAFLIAAALTAAGAVSVRFWPLIDVRHLNREPAVWWPEPQLVVDVNPTDGPVVVTLTYTIRPDDEKAFLAAMRGGVRRSRMRTGAVQWGIFRHGEIPGRMVEMYVVPTWDEHLRQHGGRLTGADRDTEERARVLSQSPPEVAHLLPAREPGT